MAGPYQSLAQPLLVSLANCNTMDTKHSNINTLLIILTCRYYKLTIIDDTKPVIHNTNSTALTIGLNTVVRRRRLV